MIIQLCGLSGAGKTTLAQKVKTLAEQIKLDITIIDGDQYRQTLCKDLGFSRPDRAENQRRLTQIASDLSQKGQVVIISAIHPYREVRRSLKSLYPGIKTIFVDCPIEILIKRDTKGLYRRALLPKDHPDKLDNLTGLGDPFDKPEAPDLHLRTDLCTIEHSAGSLLNFILQHRKKQGS